MANGFKFQRNRVRREKKPFSYLGEALSSTDTCWHLLHRVHINKCRKRCSQYSLSYWCTSSRLLTNWHHKNNTMKFVKEQRAAMLCLLHFHLLEGYFLVLASQLCKAPLCLRHCNWRVRQWVASFDWLISLCGNPRRNCCYCFLSCVVLLWRIKLSLLCIYFVYYGCVLSTYQQMEVVVIIFF